MRQAAEVGLRRARDHQRVDARGLGGHHVHHHARRVNGIAARDVEADPLDGHPALGDRRARRQRRRGVGAALVGVHGARPLDGHLQRGADVVAQVRQRRVEVATGYSDLGGPHAVEGFAVLQGRLGTPFGDRVDDRAHRGHHRLHVDSATRQRGPQLGGRQRRAPHVDARDRPWRYIHADHSPRAAQIGIGGVMRAKDHSKQCTRCADDLPAGCGASAGQVLATR